MIGFKAGANSLNYRGSSTAIGNNVYIGSQAGQTASGYQRVAIGVQAGYESSGNRVVAIGLRSFEKSEGDDNTGVGYLAGGHSTGDHNLYLGSLAGLGVIGANNIELVTEGPNPSLIGSNSNKVHIENTIIGDTSAKKIAIGNIAAGDLTPDATLEVKPKVASDIGVIVQGVASHSANLQEWQNNSEEVLARVEPNGVIFSSGVTASGLLLPNHVPVSTTNTLYNEGGTLKFNGSAVGGGGGDVSTAQLNYVSGIAVYGSGQSTSLNTASGVATYASGQAISNQSNITALLSASGTATSLIASSGIASYASGQAISNQGNITALLSASGTATSLIASSGIASYASGQAISNQGNITALLSASGTATSLIASSGAATYASGNTANISFGSNAEGDILIHNGSKFIRLAKGTDNYILKMNGNLPNWEAESSGGVSGDTFATDLKIGRDSQNLIDFATTDNKIIIRANNVNQVSLTDNVFGPEADSDVDLGTTSLRWKDAYVDSITVTGEIDGDSLDIEGDADINGTTNLDAVDIDGNVQIDGTVTVGVNDTGKDVKFFGATAGSYFEWDESEDRLNLVGAAYVNEAVPANDTPTAEDATVTLDLKKGNYHNISLGQNVTKFEFLNAKRGQRFLLRITQNASSAKTISWSNVDYTSGGAAATVRWAGNITPTMSTSTSHTDVYGFLCTNNAGSAFDGFIVGQDLHD